MQNNNSLNTNENNAISNLDILCRNSIELIRYARNLVSQHINIIEVITYYSLGKWIVEEQQNGSERAKYGENIIDRLSDALISEFGRGYSRETLRNARKFYQVYKDRVSESMYLNFIDQKSQTLFGELNQTRPFKLSWSHYLILMRAKSQEERAFYEIEASEGNWSVRTLQRQYGSSLYERLMLSTDKNKVKSLSEKGHIVEEANDIVKDPLVLEFLGLQEKNEFSESELETRIINHLQEFLMEMGKGFTFVGRQKRFTFDEDSFKVDLVLYNRLLRCFVLIDLKIGKLKHQDLGQMQMYVNYYDRYEKTEEENPTIGILLCSDKNDSMVRLTLPEDSNIYASKYELYIPDKNILQDKLKQWLAEES